MSGYRAPRDWGIVERFDRFYVENQYGGFSGWHTTIEAAIEQGREYVAENPGDTFTVPGGELFTWNGSYKDPEQVRPYMAGYLAVRAELDAAGLYPYNDSFVGRIPGLAGSANEETGIYLLQTLRRLDQDALIVAAFDGVPVTPEQLGHRVLRGSVLHHGFYMGGTGIKRYDGVRLMVDRGRLVVLPPRARTHGYALTGGHVRFSGVI